MTAKPYVLGGMGFTSALTTAWPEGEQGGRLHRQQGETDGALTLPSPNPVVCSPRDSPKQTWKPTANAPTGSSTRLDGARYPEPAGEPPAGLVSEHTIHWGQASASTLDWRSRLV